MHKNQCGLRAQILLCVIISVAVLAQDDQTNISCPQECVCYRELSTLKCHESSWADLPAITRDLASQVQVLDMTRSQLQKLKSTSLARFPRLKRLILLGNKISDIDASALENVPELEDLDLRENALKILPSKLFQNTKLKVLYLAHNPFSCESSQLTTLTSLIKYLINNVGLEFDGGLLRCAEPENMENIKLINIQLAANTGTSPHILQASNQTSNKLAVIIGITGGAVVIVPVIIIFVVFFYREIKSQKKYHYDFVTSTGEEDTDQEDSGKNRESLADRLKKQRKQSQGYPSQEIVDSDEDETLDQQSYLKKKLETQRRHSMGYADESESDRMEEINLDNP